jgi:hypothetical protein
MGSYLKMADRQRIQARLELGWSYRRIERATGVRRETVARYYPRRDSKPTKLSTGSGAKAARCPPIRERSELHCDIHLVRGFARYQLTCLIPDSINRGQRPRVFDVDVPPYAAFLLYSPGNHAEGHQLCDSLQLFDNS